MLVENQGQLFDPTTTPHAVAIPSKTQHHKAVLVSSLYQRALQSHLAREIAGTTAVVLTSAYVKPNWQPYLAISTVASAALYTWINKRLCYEASIIPTVVHNTLNPDNKPWWNEIAPGFLLGAIPLKNKGHHESIPATHILTLLEEFERDALSLVSEPVSMEDWQKCGKLQEIFDTPDFKPVDIKIIAKAVKFAQDVIAAGGSIYCHCKAGRGRSATVAVCWILSHGDQNGITLKSHPSHVEARVDEAIAYVKSKRPVININEKQRQAILDYYDAYCMNRVKVPTQQNVETPQSVETPQIVEEPPAVPSSKTNPPYRRKKYIQTKPQHPVLEFLSQMGLPFLNSQQPPPPQRPRKFKRPNTIKSLA